MSEVFQDIEIEPKITPLSGEELQDRTSNNSIKERVDIRTRGFWEQWQQAFFGYGFSTPTPVVIATGPSSSAML